MTLMPLRCLPSSNKARARLIAVPDADYICWALGSLGEPMVLLLFISAFNIANCSFILN